MTEADVGRVMVGYDGHCGWLNDLADAVFRQLGYAVEERGVSESGSNVTWGGEEGER